MGFPGRIETDAQQPTVLTVRLEATSSRWEQWFLLRSDAHHDNAHCDTKLEEKHLKRAAEREAGILDFGDLFCAMQGKWDPRADQGALIPALRVPDYTDALVDYCADFYRPFAKNWVLLAPGNHEGSIFKRHQTDLTKRLSRELSHAGSPVQVGTYAGWVRFLITLQQTHRQSFRLRYTHGYGGGGPVTQDVIQSHRQMAYIDADFLVSGHTHDSWHHTRVREVLSQSGRTALKDTECLKCPGYKDEFSPGYGFPQEKGHSPKPKGAWFIRFYVEEDVVTYDLVRAK